MPNCREPVQFLGVNVHPVDTELLFEYMKRVIRSRQKSVIANVNVNAVNLSFQLPWFGQFLRSADVVFCDGWGVILGARFLGLRIPQRITYADWVWDLARFAEANDFSIFFLGARQNIADLAAARLRRRFPCLRIVGIQHGYFNKSRESHENKAVIEMINGSRPQILLLGLGMPLQERWLSENWEDLEVNIALTGGAVFDYASSTLPRAPKFMRDYGFEWLGRFLIEPRRLWKRYLLGNARFFWRVLKESLR